MLNPGMTVKEFISHALMEDIGDGDHTSLSTIAEDAEGTADVKVKEDGIISGLVVADQVLNLIDPGVTVKVLVSEGARVKKGDVVMTTTGRIRSLLSGERLLLNCMQRMSGIATMTRKFVDALEGTGVRILDTRKTTPNFRMFEKWAVQAGGGVNHRFGLFDMILIKDNHVDASGSIGNAIRRAKEYLERTGKNLPIEIETRNEDEVRQALAEGGVQRIMLDNFSPGRLVSALKLIDGQAETEASGGITLENVKEYAIPGLDFISVGALTHSYRSLDINMKIRR